jgi:uncharacterized protein YjiS (DUF1127 family)
MIKALAWAHIYVQKKRKENKTRRELHSLSDRELMDIGIIRCDIDSISRNSFN